MDAAPVVGVLALQGSFREHITSLRRLGVSCEEVRRADQLEGKQGLIIPGGESTTMALVAERWGLIPHLRAFAAQGGAIWGTCAGLIFLAERCYGQKEGGQQLIGGLDVEVHRNFFGSQIDSFECDLPAPAGFPAEDAARPFRAMFIRAPAVVQCGAGVEALTEWDVPAAANGAAAREFPRVAVAVRQGRLLGTAFHPELTDDSRWHALFADMCKACSSYRAPSSVPTAPSVGAVEKLQPLFDLKDVPVYGKAAPWAPSTPH